MFHVPAPLGKYHCTSFVALLYLSLAIFRGDFRRVLNIVCYRTPKAWKGNHIAPTSIYCRQQAVLHRLLADQTVRTRRESDDPVLTSSIQKNEIVNCFWTCDGRDPRCHATNRQFNSHFASQVGVLILSLFGLFVFSSSLEIRVVGNWENGLR